MASELFLAAYVGDRMIGLIWGLWTEVQDPTLRSRMRSAAVKGKVSLDTADGDEALKKKEVFRDLLEALTDPNLPRPPVQKEKVGEFSGAVVSIQSLVVDPHYQVDTAHPNNSPLLTLHLTLALLLLGIWGRHRSHGGLSPAHAADFKAT